MKKFKKIAYVVLIIIIIVLSLTIYTSASKDNEDNTADKTLTEIKFLESKLTGLFNKMNNIETRNYKISYGDISKESEQQSDTGTSSSGGGGSSSGEGEGQGEGQSGGDKDGEEGSSQGSGGSGSSSQQGSSQSSGGEQQDNKKYELKMNGVLNKSDEISWEEIKEEIENLYVSIPTITIDLYQINLNQDDILSFNKEFDELTKVAKDEKKQETLDELTKLYDYIPKFLKNINEQEIYKKLIETKSHIFKAYSKLDNDKWNEMVDDMNTAISVYSQLLTDTTINSNNQYNINRMYIMLNELKNATTLEDTSVFLIKYKNVIEEIDDME